MGKTTWKRAASGKSKSNNQESFENTKVLQNPIIIPSNFSQRPLETVRSLTTPNPRQESEEEEEEEEEEYNPPDVDYEIISSRNFNDASLNILQKIIRWIQPEKISIIEPKGTRTRLKRNSSSSSSTAYGGGAVGAAGTAGAVKTSKKFANMNGGDVTFGDFFQIFVPDKGYDESNENMVFMSPYVLNGNSDGKTPVIETNGSFSVTTTSNLLVGTLVKSDIKLYDEGNLTELSAKTDALSKNTSKLYSINDFNTKYPLKRANRFFLLRKWGDHYYYQQYKNEKNTFDHFTNVPCDTKSSGLNPNVPAALQLAQSSAIYIDSTASWFVNHRECWDYSRYSAWRANHPQSNLPSFQGCPMNEEDIGAQLLFNGAMDGRIEYQHVNYSDKTGNLNTSLNVINNPDFAAADISGNVREIVKGAVMLVNRAMDLISYPFLYTQKTILYWSNQMTDTFSNVGFYPTVEPSCSDRYFVFQTIQMIIWFFICIWIWFNWYFIICYRENNLPVKTYDISWVWMRETSIILSLLFKYVICQLSFINAVVLFLQRYANFILGNIWGPKVNALLLFIIIFMLVISYHICSKVGKLFFDSISMHLSSTVVGVFIFMALIFAFYTFLIEDKVILALKFATIIPAIICIILFILRFLWSVLIIFVAGVFISVYFFLYSFFAMAIYSKMTLLETVNAILDYIAGGFEDPSPFKYSSCRPRTWWEWLVETIKWIIKLLIKYGFELVLLGLLMYNTYIYLITLKDNVNLQNAMIVLTIFMILGILGHIFRKAFPVSILAPEEEVKEVQKALGVFSVSQLTRESSRPLFPNYSASLANMFLPTVEGEAKRAAMDQARRERRAANAKS